MHSHAARTRTMNTNTRNILHKWAVQAELELFQDSSLAMEYAISLSFIVTLLLCCWVVFTSQSSCKIVSETGITFTTDITHNGVTYHNYQISIPNVQRGYRCKQGDSSKCKAMHNKAQGFSSSVADANADIQVAQNYTRRMCRPTTMNTVQHQVDVTLGGSTVQVTAEWSDITACGCVYPPPSS